MDVRQLRYFLSIARCGSFSRAAVELNVAQPALSHHVANLEAELGVKLFDRSTKGVVTTECGETLVHHAEIIVRQFSQAARDVQMRSAHPTGAVSIGLPTSISIGLTVPLLREVEARFPTLELKISENHSGYLSEWVLSGRLDMAVLFDIDPSAPFEVRHLLTESLYFVTAPGAHEATREHIDLADIKELPLILTGPNHGLRQVIDRQSVRGAFDLRVKTELDSLVAIKHLVADGYGHSILPWCAIADECTQGRLHAMRIENPKLERRVYLASSRDWPQSRASEIVAQMVVQSAAQLVKSDQWRGKLPTK